MLAYFYSDDYHMRSARKTLLELYEIILNLRYQLPNFVGVYRNKMAVFKTHTENQNYMTYMSLFQGISTFFFFFFIFTLRVFTIEWKFRFNESIILNIFKQEKTMLDP